VIDPRAIVDPQAKLADDVDVGPFSIIGPHVTIDSGCWVGSHVVIEGHTRIGKNNKIYQFASVGCDPQDKKYGNEPTRLEIGDNNVIREYCTLSTGTIQDNGITRIGSRNWIMAYVHIAHDCLVGNDTIFANSTALAGHVRVEDYAILGGFTTVHQFCAIGTHAFCGLNSSISMDVPPFVTVSGVPAKVHGINSEGLKRRGFSAEQLGVIKKAYKTLYKSGLKLDEAIAELKQMAEQSEDVFTMAAFLEKITRGVVR
jgi:UDP-N-acetylglucosamine acyltransferase